MVNFSQQIVNEREKEWEASYMDYDKLKGLLNISKNKLDYSKITNETYVNRQTSFTLNKSRAFTDTSGEFFKAIESEMRKVDEFTHELLISLKKKASKVESKVSKDQIDKLSPEDRKKITEEAEELGKKFLKIERFANLNYLGFHKILKKHDKVMPTKCKKFYISRLHQQRWIRDDYSKLFVELSKIYSELRGDKAGIDENNGAQNFVRSTTKYWVRIADVSKVKHIILQHLPIFQHNLDALPGDNQFCSSVYFDNAQLELYHGRLDKTPNAIAIRFRWYATEFPELVFVERKTHHDSWTGKVSVKERFTLRESQVMPFLEGTYTLEDKIKEMKQKNAKETDIENTRRLFTEIYNQITSKQCQPCMRTVYNRVAYQIPFNPTVRISLDTNLTMIAENPRDGPDCASQNRWFRNPNHILPPTDITHFPHAVLEVKLALKEGEEKPAWVDELIESNLVTRIHKFSKFIHGCATLIPDEVQAFPYWIDDLSIRPSILRSQPINAKRQDFSWGKSKHEPIELMTRTESTVRVGRQLSLTDLLNEKPRKTPLKIEPKVFFSNERTLLSWLSISMTLGTLTVALVTVDDTKSTPGAHIDDSNSGLSLIGFLLMPLSVLFAVYALTQYLSRRKYLKLRIDNGIFFDESGPFFLGMTLLFVLTVIFLSKL